MTKLEPFLDKNYFSKDNNAAIHTRKFVSEQHSKVDHLIWTPKLERFKYY